MIYNLGPNLSGPQQQVRQRVANFVLGKFSHLGDLCLGQRAAANRLAHAIGWRQLTKHAGNTSGGKAGLGINGQTRFIRY